MFKKILVLLICILYPTHILMDLTGSYPYADYTKFAVIACAFIISLYGHITLVKMAIFLTLICDYTLIFTNYSYLGVSIFSVVQLIYSYILLSKKSKTTKYVYYILAVLPFIYYFAFKGPLVCILYALVLLSNLIMAVKTHRPNLIWAFSLFALCDLCVAAYNLTGISFFHQLIWIFYTPSQLLLSLSASKEWQPRKI